VKLVTSEQYLNRIIEWVPSQRMPEAAETFYDIIENGYSPEEAFEIVIHF